VAQVVRDIVDSSPQTVHPNRLPVVEGGRPVGVVTRVDVLGAVASE
jgi:CBS domain-containing protein